jgi:hypothetical protein
MLLLFIISLLAVAGYLLALVSDAFGYGLSRVVEPAFDFVEYRLALRERRRQGIKPREEHFAREAVYSH